MDLVLIGNRIKDARVRLDLSITQLARKSQQSVAHISSMERGACNFSVTSLVQVADALNLSTDYILYGVTACRIGVVSEIMKDCTPKEINILTENIFDLKRTLRKHGASRSAANS